MLRHFKPEEFHPWFNLMNPALLFALDDFREALGAPVQISPAPGAIGRDDDSRSQHNVRITGMVNAVDVMPYAPLREAYLVAIELEVFSGIGVYPDWKPRPGLHLDVRASRLPKNPALWGMVRNTLGEQTTVTIAAALARVNGHG